MRSTSRTWSPLLNYSIRTQEKRSRNRQPECLCGLQIDHEIQLGRLLDRERLRLRSSQDPINVAGGAPEQIVAIYSITDESTILHELRRVIDRRESSSRGQPDDVGAVG